VTAARVPAEEAAPPRLQRPLPPGRGMGLSDSRAPTGLRQSPSASAWSSAFFISPV
jgi:hypothetical protein